ncbi:hypothetical protein BJI49_09920 [Acetobacter pasteurianus]|nr:hypothetical protein BJI49_09920 [Acetobacter pasteurianus]GAB30240.1 hypothetical protein APS_0842 [Acetobacter pasteurianus subsp. pasteurianus LMG 1262 = NBRC 106471]
MAKAGQFGLTGFFVRVFIAGEKPLMTYAAFYKEEDEQRFQDWQRAHPSGIFINSSPGRLNPKYIVAHRSGCMSVQQHKGRTVVYSKHCFDSLHEAQDYLRAECGAAPSTGCSRCKPAG